LATAALGAALPAIVLSDTGIDPVKAVTAPMIVAAIGIILSISWYFYGSYKRIGYSEELLNALLIGTGGSSVLILIAMAGMAYLGWVTWGVFWAVIIGLAAGVIIGQATEYLLQMNINQQKVLPNKRNKDLQQLLSMDCCWNVLHLDSGCNNRS
jgi:K(+)-stimulated pyrophosphate-energized sodium pump